jgi:hypothetical protein
VATTGTSSTSLCPGNSLPPSIIPHYISTSDASKVNLRCKAENTVVRRKSLFGQNIIVEATKASGDIMAG